MAALGVACCLYLIAEKESIAHRAGLPTTADMLVSTVGLVLLLVATYRALGLPMVGVALAFVVYVFFGDQPFIPDVAPWKVASYGTALWADGKSVGEGQMV